jgi:membrane protein YdbS with pleckstrin-like domain
MESLDAKVRIVWLVGSLLTASVLGGGAVFLGRFVFEVGFWPGVGVFLFVLAVGAIGAVLRYRRWRFEVDDDAVHLERGVLTHVTSVVPFVRVQHVDSQRGPVERTVGLASVVVYTAGSRGADVTIPGLSPERADALRERLRRLAIESDTDDAV